MSNLIDLILRSHTIQYYYCGSKLNYMYFDMVTLYSLLLMMAQPPKYASRQTCKYIETNVWKRAGTLHSKFHINITNYLWRTRDRVNNFFLFSTVVFVFIFKFNKKKTLINKKALDIFYSKHTVITLHSVRRLKVQAPPWIRFEIFVLFRIFSYQSTRRKYFFVYKCKYSHLRHHKLMDVNVETDVNKDYFI